MTFYNGEISRISRIYPQSNNEETITQIYTEVHCAWNRLFKNINVLKGRISKGEGWVSPVAQWMRICLPVQESQTQPLAWEDPTYRRAAEPTCCNC